LSSRVTSTTEIKIRGSSSSASIRRRVAEGAAARFAEQSDIVLAWEQASAWETLDGDNRFSMALGPWSSPISGSGRTSPDIASRESASGADVLGEEILSGGTSQGFTSRRGNASEADKGDTGAKKNMSMTNN
jgi:hypothetical protein